MPHVFDTGAVLPQRRLIREQVVAKLVGLRKANGGYLGAIAQMPVLFESGDDDSRAAFATVAEAGHTPLVAIALGDRDFEGAGMGSAEQWIGDLEIQVLIAQRVDRTELKTVAGDVVSAADVTAAPGTETILEHVFERLAGQRIRTAIGLVAGATQAAELRPVREGLAWFGDGWIVWELRFAVTVASNVNHQRGNATVVTEILASHNVDGATVDETHDANPVAETLSDLEAP